MDGAILDRIRGDVEQVLRLSPPGARIAGPADIGRQGRIMDAIGRAGLPAPPAIATDSAPRIDGRAFALMGLVEGDDWTVARAAAGDGALAAAAVRNLLRMRELPAPATGIDRNELRGPGRGQHPAARQDRHAGPARPIPRAAESRLGALVLCDDRARPRRPAPGFAAYSASRAAVSSVARSVNQSEMTDQYAPGYLEGSLPWIPAGRLGSANELAAVVVFLASDAAGYLTGQTLTVDGGLTIT